MNLLLDTNVLSELLRSAPSRAVLAWLAARRPDTLFVSAITEAEMSIGARLLPAGRRRDALQRALRGLFEEDFAQRILPFESASVPHYVELVAARRAAGRPISQFDAQIAAIARQCGGSVVTRNVADFHGCGIDVIDPWGE